MVVAAIAALAGETVAITLGLVVPVAITLEQGVAVATTLVQGEAVATTLVQGVAEAVATTLASPLEDSHPFLQAFQGLVLPQASQHYLPAYQAQECLVGTGQGMVVGVGAPQGLEEVVVGVDHQGHHMEQ